MKYLVLEIQANHGGTIGISLVATFDTRETASENAIGG